ncbi:thiolase family protein [Lactobacillus intestinalis]|uniref:acetyl-CoA C-acetyltransferase n=1 Tax=Lactobacillus intestinalis TaxID=151781 RepID=A0A4S2BJD8_9LACO|nr:thiolase family protein [Lactobacillus intestinalis]KAI4310152.1 putative acetyl-CoA acyltransferase [Lactobacillus intestinalis]TGY14631.1 thiolase family protein [Lactobacillus intestinalis]
MKDIYIVAAKRTPFGRYRGFFKEQSATDLGVLALTKTLEAIDLDPAEVEGVFMGNVIAAGLGENMARQVALRSGLSETTVATTVNDVCGSSLKALRLAQGQMMMGDLDLVAVGGSESMTNAPFIVDKKYKDDAQNHLQNSMLVDALIDAFSGEHMGITAENVAEEYNIARQEMDEFSVNSHQKAVKAIKEDSFDEILPITINGQTLTHDESVRSDTNLEALSNLKTVFKEDGKVTAGNASPLNDGASMLILATEDKVKELNLKPIAKLGAFAEAGFDPALMGYTPYYAVQKLLDKNKTTIDDYDVFEVNEAFASQAVALKRDLKIPANKLNILGGAIALGHPLGATGTRLIATAISALNKVNGKRAIATLCIGGGQAIAYEIKRD